MVNGGFMNSFDAKLSRVLREDVQSKLMDQVMRLFKLPKNYHISSFKEQDAEHLAYNDIRLDREPEVAFIITVDPNPEVDPAGLGDEYGWISAFVVLGLDIGGLVGAVKFVHHGGEEPEGNIKLQPCTIEQVATEVNERFAEWCSEEVLQQGLMNPEWIAQMTGHEEKMGELGKFFNHHEEDPKFLGQDDLDGE